MRLSSAERVVLYRLKRTGAVMSVGTVGPGGVIFQSIIPHWLLTLIGAFSVGLRGRTHRRGVDDRCEISVRDGARCFSRD